ncbi:MAG: NusG domain II-containing protein [Spirochaetes bacterium]|nr:NusG domain II-containing protein [Spirochaetota bacterium]
MKKLTLLDIIITAIFLLIVIFILFYNFFYKIGSDSILLVETPYDQYYYSLTQKKKIEVKGVLGLTTIEIDNGKFRFNDSPCLHKDCIRMGWISKHNYPVICLPNKVSAYIVDKKPQSQYDGISR